MRLLIVISVCVILLFGCSSVDSPVTSENDSQMTNMNFLPLINLSEAEEASNAIGLLGAYDLLIDAENMDVELTPKRSLADIGDSYLLEGMAYFTIWPCPDCMKWVGVAITPDGGILVRFELRHPFGTPPDPCTPPRRIDLNIFDVAIFVHPESMALVDYALVPDGIYALTCLNADGYSSELGIFLNDQAALPYFLVVDDNENAENTYNIFPQGATERFDVVFVPSSIVRFSLYLTFGYGASAVKSSRCDPKYFNPEFNRKNAWKVEVIPPGMELGTTWDHVDDVTPYNVEVYVWDWQQNGVAADPLVNSTDVRYSSNVASVSVEIPGMINEPANVTTEISGTGNDPGDPLIYQIPIANENLIAVGEYIGLVKVLDERVPPSNPSEGDVDALIHSPDGMELNWMQINNGEFATYQTFIATVVEGIEAGKNIGLRDNFEALDLAVDHADGDLYILYDDGEIWKYTEAGEYLIGTALLDQPGPGYQYIDIGSNSYKVVVGYKSGLDNGKFFLPDDSYYKDFYYGTDWPACFAYDALAYTGSSLTDYLGAATCGCTMGTYAKWLLYPPSTYSTFVTPAPYKTVGCGVSNVGYYSSQNQGIPTREIIKGVESSKDTMDFVYYLESKTTSYVCDEFRVQRFTWSGSSLIDDLWWGGTQSDDGSVGFWDPKDITRDADNDYYILDILSDGTPEVKKYTEDGAYVGAFGDATIIDGTPLRIEGSDYVGPNGSAIFVLHEDTPADKLSIFYPSEMP